MDHAERKADEGRGGTVTLIHRFGATVTLNISQRCPALGRV